ncbi:hypothetical protein [Providencia sp. Je.9.19]|uniref:hypothetical protein n=1 Tax=Providencia sp. Je.9.19 TaxID=3142844 RepID=UPI003DA92EC2
MNYKLMVVFSVFLLGACQTFQGNKGKENDGNIISSSERKDIKTPSLFFKLQMLYFYEFKDVLDREKCARLKSKKEDNPFFNFIKYPKEAFVKNLNHEKAIYFYRKNLNEMGMPYNAWILADVLDVVNERNRETLWQQFVYVMNKDDPAEEIKLFMILWYTMVREAAKPLSDKQIKSKRWLMKMRQITLVNNIERKLDFVFEEMINDSKLSNEN